MVIESWARLSNILALFFERPNALLKQTSGSEIVISVKPGQTVLGCDVQRLAFRLKSQVMNKFGEFVR